MAYTAVVKSLIYNTGPCYNHPLRVFLRIAIYFAGEAAEVFSCMTGTDYAYNRAPKSMKILVQAIWLAMAGIGSCLALALNPLAKDPRFGIMYSILALLLGISTVLLWLIFRHLDKEATTML